MFTKITLDNFRCFSHFQLDLTENKTDKKGKKLAIIYGENGVGKSTIIQAFSLLKKTVTSFDRNQFLLRMLNKRKEEKSTQYDYISSIEREINNSRIDFYIDRYFKIGAEDKKMSLQYEGVIDKSGTKFLYQMIFHKKEIFGEKLTIDQDEVFSATKNELVLSENHFISDEFNKMLKNDFSMYFGLQTFLSCVIGRSDSVVSSFIRTALSKSLRKLLSGFEKMDIYRPTINPRYHDYAYTRDSKLLNNIVTGVCDRDFEKKASFTKKLLSSFYSSLYKNIEGVEYDIRESNNDTFYSLVFIEKTTDDSIIKIPYEMESTGTNKLLALFTYFYNAVNSDDVLLIDEIDNGINDILLRTIINSLADKIKGQLIITTHNTYLLNNKHKKYTYILNRKEDNTISSYSLDTLGSAIQDKTDVIGRFVKGIYGGLPKDDSFDVDSLMDKEDKNN